MEVSADHEDVTLSESDSESIEESLSLSMQVLEILQPNHPAVAATALTTASAVIIRVLASHLGDSDIDTTISEFVKQMTHQAKSIEVIRLTAEDIASASSTLH